MLMKDHPKIRMEATPVRRSLFLTISGDAKDLDAVKSDMVNHSSYHHLAESMDHLSFIAVVPPSESRLLRSLESMDLLLLPPIVYYRGRMRMRLLHFGEGNVDGISSLLQEGRLHSKKLLRENDIEQELITSGLLLPSLTMKQGRSIIAALESGYYDTPRGVTTGEVAHSLGISRSTFEEHLRSAESQIIKAAAPVVRMHMLEKEGGAEAAGTEALKLYARYSRDLGLYVNMTIHGDKLASVSFSEKPPKGNYGRDHPYLARVLEHISTGQEDLRDIPLDLRVTPFEREVLETLRKVPPGELITYGDVARLLGRPGAARAIGNICAKNPAPVVVPCHRVVPSTGGLGNYTGGKGVSTKRRLLEREGAIKKIDSRVRSPKT